MELVVIAFAGTLMLMLGEFRDLVRRSQLPSGTALPRSTTSDLAAPSVAQRSPAPEEEHYDVAA